MYFIYEKYELWENRVNRNKKYGLWGTEGEVLQAELHPP